MSAHTDHVLTAVFDSSVSAERAASRLREQGVPGEDIRTIEASSPLALELFERGPVAVRNAGRQGAIVGGLSASVAATVLALPSLGVLGVSIPVAAATGLLIGAFTGFGLGRLLGRGIPKREDLMRRHDLPDAKVVMVDLHEPTRPMVSKTLRREKPLDTFTAVIPEDAQLV